MCINNWMNRCFAAIGLKSIKSDDEKQQVASVTTNIIITFKLKIIYIDKNRF